MQVASASTDNPYPDFNPALSPLAIGLIERRLAELNWLSEIALDRVKHLEKARNGEVGEAALKGLIGRGGMGAEFGRAVRSQCQIVVLELELLGLRDAPDRGEREPCDIDSDRDDPENDIERPERSDLAERPETDAMLLGEVRAYRKGPLDIVVAEIRKALEVDAPEDDPFAPPPERRASKPRASNENSVDSVPRGTPETALSEGTECTPVKASKAVYPCTAFEAEPVKPRRILNKLLATAARNRGPPW